MPVPVDTSRILLGRAPATREEAVRLIGELMVALGDVTPRYLEGMLEKEARQGTWLTEGIALPHGTIEVRGEVLRSTVVVLQIPGGIEWGAGRTVYLAFGVAGKAGDEHLRLLSGLAAVLQDAETVKRMRETNDPAEMAAILAGREAAV